MPRTGPAPKPTAIRKAEGTTGRGASGRNKREPKPPVKVPPAPRELSDDARVVWQRLGKHLAAHGLITSLDELAFAALCDSYAAFLRLTAQAAQLGGDIVKVHGQLVSNPARVAAGREFEKFRKLLAEFGLTPAARTRIAVEADPARPADGIEQFMKIAK